MLYLIYMLSSLSATGKNVCWKIQFYRIDIKSHYSQRKVQWIAKISSKEISFCFIMAYKYNGNTYLRYKLSLCRQ